MALRKILTQGDSALEKVCRPVEKFDRKLHWLLDDMKETLEALAQKYEFIVERRGLGLMQGLVFDRPVGGVITKALDRGLILINAGANIIRFVPPLVISRENVDEMVEILESCL